MPYGKISAGANHTCLVTDSGTVECWGWNTDADGNEVGQASPPSGAFTQVSAGALHTCGLRSDGEIECWGSNEHGQSDPPSRRFVQVAAGVQHTCGLTVDGAVLCWGLNDRGQTNVPDLSGTTIASITAGSYFSCAHLTGGVARCWTEQRPDWREGWPGYVQIDAGWYEVCGLRRLQHLCFSTSGGSGRGHGGDPHIEISAGTFGYCTVRDSGAITCRNETWFANPIDWAKVIPAGPFVRVTAGAQHACGMTTDGKVRCWGNNDHGQTDVPEALR